MSFPSVLSNARNNCPSFFLKLLSPSIYFPIFVSGSRFSDCLIEKDERLDKWLVLSELVQHYNIYIYRYKILKKHFGVPCKIISIYLTHQHLIDISSTMINNMLTKREVCENYIL